jgi:phosphoenolpyruvate carboxylase
VREHQARHRAAVDELLGRVARPLEALPAERQDAFLEGLFFAAGTPGPPDAALSPETQEVLRTLQTLALARPRTDREALRDLVISNARDDVLALLVCCRPGSLRVEGRRVASASTWSAVRPAVTLRWTMERFTPAGLPRAAPRARRSR